MKRNTFLKSLGLLAAGIVSGNKIFGAAKKNTNIRKIDMKKVEENMWRIHTENQKHIKRIVDQLSPK